MDIEKIADRIVNAKSLKPVDTVTIEIKADNPELFFSEDGLVRLSGNIKKAIKKELDFMKKIPVSLEVKINSKSGDWQEKIKN